MKAIVIYHRADFDGIFCREIAHKFLPDAELVGWDHGQPLIPCANYDQVYILDLSPECVLNANTDTIIWIDHHKSSIEKYAPGLSQKDIPGYRIDGVAACRLAWQWFLISEHNAQNQTNEALQVPLPGKQDYVDRSVSEPLAVRLAGEYDIWDKRDPDAELFQHGLRSRELTGYDWTILLASPMKPTIDEIERMIDVGHPIDLRPDGTADMSVPFVRGLLKAGEAIQYAKTHENESIIKAAGYTLEFEGLKFLACNHARYNSLLFTAGLAPEHDACLGFAWRDGKWTVSLYHALGKEHHDLSQIAVKYGGGGHRGACGFQLEQSAINQILCQHSKHQ